jgi:hypothetical protein
MSKANTSPPRISQNIFLRSDNSTINQYQGCDLWQDKRARTSPRTASEQPAPGSHRSHVQELKTVIEQIQIYTKSGQTLEKITAYIPKDVKAVLQRLADQGLGQDEALSLSAIGVATG